MQAVVVSVSSEEAELASDALWALGVVAIEERTTAGGAVELWTSLGEIDGAELASITVAWPRHWSRRLVTVDETVADNWRAFAAPIHVTADLVVMPRWVVGEGAPLPIGRDVATHDGAMNGGATIVYIEPGATFGMGDHPTTVLSLRAIQRLVTAHMTVLDVGCGSGVLAVAACMLGAAKAVAIDIAPAAVPVTRDNAAANGVASQIEVSTTPLAEVTGTYQLVVANILAPALIELADDLRRVLAPDGTLVISGILDSRHDHVLAALEPLEVLRTDTLDGWAAVTLGRPTTAPA